MAHTKAEAARLGVIGADGEMAGAEVEITPSAVFDAESAEERAVRAAEPKPAELVDAEAEYVAAAAAWLGLYKGTTDPWQRVVNGQAYCQMRIWNGPLLAKLAALKRQVDAAWWRYKKAGEKYREVRERLGGDVWPIDERNHELLDTFRMIEGGEQCQSVTN